MKTPLVDLEVSVVIDNPKYRSVLVTDGEREVWLPRSEIELEYSGGQNAQTATVTMPEWLAIAKELV